MMKGCSKCNLSGNSELILKDYKLWTAVVSESPTPIGWIYIVLKRHIEYFDELTDEELLEVKQVIHELKAMLTKAFKPDWFNVMQLGNGGKHVHFHLVPRYKGKVKFEGRIFTDPDYGKMLVDRYKPDEREFLIKLRDYLKKNI